MQINIQFASKDEGLFANHISKLTSDNEFKYYGWIRSYKEITDAEKWAVVNAVEGITRRNTNAGCWLGTGSKLVKEAGLPKGIIIGSDFINKFYIVFGL